MCGSCGAAGPMVSYEPGEYIMFAYPQKGIPHCVYGFIRSINEQWGMEVQILKSKGTTSTPPSESTSITIPQSQSSSTGSSILSSANTNILWIDWSPFACTKEFPGFMIGRVDSQKIPYDITVSTEHSNEEKQKQQRSTIKYDSTITTIGHGWLQQPFVLPKQQHQQP
mmetsp:Transcript_34411/g.38519  ORF Transcript_34411/g.38519 Transcript_34411/m.38519 type:complete len:168 (-) Transcript_34411:223-726(-)